MDVSSADLGSVLPSTTTAHFAFNRSFKGNSSYVNMAATSPQIRTNSTLKKEVLRATLNLSENLWDLTKCTNCRQSNLSVRQESNCCRLVFLGKKPERSGLLLQFLSFDGYRKPAKSSRLSKFSCQSSPVRVNDSTQISACNLEDLSAYDRFFASRFINVLHFSN